MLFIHEDVSSQCKKLGILIYCLFTFLFFIDVAAWAPLDTLKIKEVGKIAISSTEKQIAYEVLVPNVTEEKGTWLTEIKRVPSSQGFELYTALKYQNIPTKLILYADSGHSLSNPKTIVEGIKHNLDWFNLWLKEKSTYELRAFIPDFEKAKETLTALHAVPKGDYAFKDYIYHPKEKKYDLNKEFVRLRIYQKTNWNQKMVELMHKVKTTPGSTGVNKLKKQFDSKYQADRFLNDHELAFSYNRRGIEYALGNLRIFLEKIEGLPPSIEVLSPSREDIDRLFDRLHPNEILSDSVPKRVEAINNNSF